MYLRRLTFLFTFFPFLLSLSAMAQMYEESDAKNLPLMEAGIGIAYGESPHYPGSDQRTKLLLPFPAFVYRGERLRADRSGGLRNRFFYNDRFEVNASMGGSFPVSNDNDERAGMPELDLILEIGPGLIWKIISNQESQNYRLALNIPIRAAFSISFEDTFGRGYAFHPFLYGFYKVSDALTLFHGSSARWATKDYHQYIYNVSTPYVTSTRSYYEAKGGFVQSTHALGVIYKYEQFQLFSFLMLTDASANANKESPLFVQDTNYSGVLGITWWFWKKG